MKMRTRNRVSKIRTLKKKKNLKAGFPELAGGFVLEGLVRRLAEELEEQRHDRVEVPAHAVAH